MAESQIRAAYEPSNLKTDEIDQSVFDFLDDVLTITKIKALIPTESIIVVSENKRSNYL